MTKIQTYFTKKMQIVARIIHTSFFVIIRIAMLLSVNLKPFIKTTLMIYWTVWYCW